MKKANTKQINIERALDYLSCIFPSSKRKQTCFFSIRPGPGGPSTFALKLKTALEKQGVKVIFRNPGSATAALLFTVSWGNWFYGYAKRRDVKTVLRVDGFPVPVYFDNRQHPALAQSRELTPQMMKLNYRLQRGLYSADHVVYQSAFSKLMTDTYLYKRRSDFSIIYNAVDLQLFETNKVRDNRRLRLLSAGSLRHEYMLGSVLPVFERLWEKFDLELMIVGSMDDINRELLARFCKSKPRLAERIMVTGWIDNSELPKILQKADILIHPRLGDWCPNIVIEALASGMPIACGSWGGAAELVGGGGIIVETSKWSYDQAYIEGLSDAVEEIINNLESYSKSARLQAEEKFDINMVAELYMRDLNLID